MTIEQRQHELGLELPAGPVMPPGVRTSFSWVRWSDAGARVRSVSRFVNAELQLRHHA